MFDILAESPSDGPAIDHLLDLSFGSDRHRKASYRFRAGVAHRADLARVARSNGPLVGTIRYWPIRIDEMPALLLGPLGVDPTRRGQGIGRALVRATLALAGADEPTAPAIVLVGEADYYAPLGFVVAPPDLVMPGEVPQRLMLFARQGPRPRGVLRRVAACSPAAAHAPAAALD